MSGIFTVKDCDTKSPSSSTFLYMCCLTNWPLGSYNQLGMNLVSLLPNNIRKQLCKMIRLAIFSCCTMGSGLSVCSEFHHPKEKSVILWMKERPGSHVHMEFCPWPWNISGDWSTCYTGFAWNMPRFVPALHGPLSSTEQRIAPEYCWMGFKTNNTMKQKKKNKNFSSCALLWEICSSYKFLRMLWFCSWISHIFWCLFQDASSI